MRDIVEGGMDIMSAVSLEERLLYDLKHGWITAEEIKEVLKQREVFNQQRQTIESKHYGKVVAIADGKLFVGNTVHEVLNAAKQFVPDKPAYLESVGFDLL
jgi:hypothetical protein